MYLSTLGHDITFVNDMRGLGPYMKYSFFQRNVYDWDKLLTDDLHASSVNK